MSATGPNLDEETRSLLQTFGFDEATFESLRERAVQGETSSESNRIRGEVEPPHPEDVDPLPPLGSDARASLHEKGAAAIARGEVGAIILAGGMATRFGGVVKAGVPVIGEKTFLDLKLDDIGVVAERCDGVVHTYPMTSFATHEGVRSLAAPRSTERMPIECFPQFISLRLTPEGELFRDADGKVSPYAPGHGDLPFALRRSGVLDSFIEGGGKVLFMSNVDNLTATLDPAVIGAHLASGRPMTVEVAPKAPNDKGGAPARVNGRLEIVESFRFPEGFDQDSIPVFNTNTFVFDAVALRDTDLDLTFFAVTKNVDGKEALQFERLVGQVSAFIPTHCLRVERSGPDARFQPIKKPNDLESQLPAIRGALEARGVL